ncbi:MAG TPA: formate dehydrogenase subunit delta [Candidatus Lustribacter sp.]|nr:formate dehydrogenase subunit delta [Candidatus Lustribacter sp.]
MSGHESAVVRMGHDIVRQLAHLPRALAAEEIATHIKKFWEPRMRHELLARIRSGDMTLEPLLVAAAEHLVDGETDDAEMAEPSGG